MRDDIFSPRDGTAIQESGNLAELKASLLVLDSYQADAATIAWGSLKEDKAGYILTQEGDKVWAWRYDSGRSARAAFEHFRAATFADWAYTLIEPGLIPSIDQHGLLPVYNLMAPDAIRCWRSPAGLYHPTETTLIRFPWP